MVLTRFLEVQTHVDYWKEGRKETFGNKTWRLYMIKKVIVVLSTMCVIIATSFAMCLAYTVPQSGVHISHNGSTTYEQGWIDFEGDSLNYYVKVYLVKNNTHYGTRWNEVSQYQNLRLYSNTYQISGSSVGYLAHINF